MRPDGSSRFNDVRTADAGRHAVVVPRSCSVLAMAVALAVEATAGGGGCPEQAFGLVHQPLGGATLAFNDGELVVSGFGRSGDDGVTIGLGDAEGWSGAVDIGVADALAEGSRTSLTSAFAVADLAVSATLEIQASAGQAAIGLAVSGCDGCPLIVELLGDGAILDLVEHAAVPRGAVALGAFGTTEAGPPRFRAAAGGDGSIVLTMAMANDTAVTLAGSRQPRVSADTLRLSLHGLPAAHAREHSMTITAANLPSLALSDEALVQFGAEHRRTLEATLLGELDRDDGPTLAIGGIDRLLGGGVNVRSPLREAGNDGCADWVTGAEFRLDLSAPKGPLPGFLLVGAGRRGDGSHVEIGSAWHAITMCGCLFSFAVPDPPSDNNAEKLLTARLDGTVVGQATPPGFNMWSAGVDSIPPSWTLELVQTDVPEAYSYRVIWRFDEATPVSLSGFGGAMADEVEVLVVASTGGAGAPVELVETELAGANAFGSQGFTIVDERFLPPLGPAPPVGDLDSDGVVGAADLALLLGSWGRCAECPADLTADSVVDAADLAVLLGAWSE